MGSPKKIPFFGGCIVGSWAQPRGWVNATCCWWFSTSRFEQYLFHGNLWSLVLCQLSLRCISKSNKTNVVIKELVQTFPKSKSELRGLAYEEFAARQCWRQFWSWSLSLWHVYARPRTCSYYIRFEWNPLCFFNRVADSSCCQFQRCPLQDRQLRNRMLMMMMMMWRLPCQWVVLG